MVFVCHFDIAGYDGHDPEEGGVAYSNYDAAERKNAGNVV